MNDPIWDHTNGCDILIDTLNSTENLAGSHIVGQPEQIFRRPDPAFEDIEIFVNVVSDTIQNDRLYHFLDNYNK